MEVVVVMVVVAVVVCLWRVVRSKEGGNIMKQFFIRTSPGSELAIG